MSNKTGKIITALLISIILNACGQSDSKLKAGSDGIEKSTYEVKAFHYDSLTIPFFFSELCKNHQRDFYLTDSTGFNAFCSDENVNPSDSSNISKYFTIKILHSIFTSHSASNCSRGDVTNIPYQWHWIEPNPRYNIYFASGRKLLKETKPPKEFSKYRSFADIDRTPYLFISDFVSQNLKYYSATCDTFSTFGWCSEREMAFIALLKLLGYEGKVIAEGNHSWSELSISFKLNTGHFQHFKVIVDNTFNRLNLEIMSEEDSVNWKTNIGSSNLAGWYNQKANSKVELDNIKTHLVSAKAMARIESEIVMYLDKKINER